MNLVARYLGFDPEILQQRSEVDDERTAYEAAMRSQENQENELMLLKCRCVELQREKALKALKAEQEVQQQLDDAQKAKISLDNLEMALQHARESRPSKKFDCGTIPEYLGQIRCFDMTAALT